MSGRVDGKPFLRTWASAAGSGVPFALRGSGFGMVMMKVRVQTFKLDPAEHFSISEWTQNQLVPNLKKLQNKTRKIAENLQ